MGGLFSGLGRSSKKEKQPEIKIEAKTEGKPSRPPKTEAPPSKKSTPEKGAPPQESKKTNEQTAKKPAAQKPSTAQATTSKTAASPTSTNKQPHSERSPSMRLSKNAPKKVDNDFDIPSDPIAPSPSYTSSSTSIGTKVEPKITPCATIGPKISFKGELSGEEDLLVQGYVEGSITLKNNHLIIGKLGTVKANIEAKTITVEGNVEGDIIGQEKVEIKATSQVTGNLKAERVTLEDGAKFRGSIDMGTPAGKTNSTAKSPKQTPEPTSETTKTDTV